tara:strand:+ start:2220 stop:2456 length:237 start_codon:yes stop_codon:yes gene_type:complete
LVERRIWDAEAAGSNPVTLIMEYTIEELEMMENCIRDIAESMRFYGSYSEYKESRQWTDLANKIKSDIEEKRQGQSYT